MTKELHVFCFKKEKDFGLGFDPDPEAGFGFEYRGFPKSTNGGIDYSSPGFKKHTHKKQ